MVEVGLVKAECSVKCWGYGVSQEEIAERLESILSNDGFRIKHIQAGNLDVHYLKDVGGVKK